MFILTFALQSGSVFASSCPVSCAKSDGSIYTPATGKSCNWWSESTITRNDCSGGLFDPVTSNGKGVIAPVATPSQFQFQPIVSVPLPTGGAVGANTSLVDYFNAAFTLAIAVSGILAVVMIAFEGLRYMASDVIGKKAEALAGLRGALLGLVLLLLSYVIFNVINPNILNFNLFNKDLNALGGVSTPATVTSGNAANAPKLNDAPPGTNLSGRLTEENDTQYAKRIQLENDCKAKDMPKITLACKTADGGNVARPASGCTTEVMVICSK